MLRSKSFKTFLSRSIRRGVVIVTSTETDTGQLFILTYVLLCNIIKPTIVSTLVFAYHTRSKS